MMTAGWLKFEGMEGTFEYVMHLLCNRQSGFLDIAKGFVSKDAGEYGKLWMGLP